jgi:hypothetical protein
MRLICVPPDEARNIWPKVYKLIHEAMWRGNISSFRDVADAVLTGNALLWLAIDTEWRAVAITQTRSTEWRKVCTILACAGKDMRRWLPLLKLIEDYARDEGCSAVRICGRKGWQRVLLSQNYRAKRVILEKEIA